MPGCDPEGVRVLVRATVLVLVGAGLAVAASFLGHPAGSATLGAGLLVFAAAVVVSFVWALFDARAVGLRRALGRWLLVAVLYALAMLALVRALDPGDFDLGVYLHDLPATGLFDAVLVVVPAVIGCFIGAALGRVRG